MTTVQENLILWLDEMDLLLRGEYHTKEPSSSSFYYDEIFETMTL